MELIDSLQKKLGIDLKDMKIISLLIKKPEMSQSEIAKKLKITQPSINVRVKRLKQRGVLKFNAGFNFNETGLSVVKVDFAATDPQKILKKLKECPFFVNGFVTSGKDNCLVFFMHNDLKRIDDIINFHLRSKKDVDDVNTKVIINSVGEFLLKMDVDNIVAKNEDGCKECPLQCQINP